MKGLKGVANHLFVLIVLGVLLGTTIWMYITFFHAADKETAEYYVLEKQSEKGMFLGPQYQVITDNNTVGNLVSKKEFDSLEFGDVISGYETREYGFFTHMDQLYDGSLLLLLIFMLGLMFIIMVIGIIAQIPIFDRAIRKREEHRTKKKKHSWLKIGIMAAFIILALSYTSLFSLNLFHKLIPIEQISTTGHIIDREYDLNIKPKADYSTYELTIIFTAQDDEIYQVKKGVTRETYYKHEYKDSIDLKYRNNNPYDIFIKTESMGEMIGAVGNISTAIYLLCLFIFYLIFRSLKQKRNAQHKEEND